MHAKRLQGKRTAMNRPALQNVTEYWVAVIGQTLALVLHGIFLALFYAYDIRPLYYFNYFSVTLFIVVVWVTVRLRRLAAGAMVAMTLEILLHQLLGVYLLGWGYGFQYFLIAVCAFLGLVGSQRLATQMLLAGICFLTLAAAYWLHLHVPPSYSMPAAVRVFLYIFNLASTFVIIATVAMIFSHAERQYKERLAEESNTDPLTRLSNRRWAMTCLASERARVRRCAREFVVAIGDLDDFKQINDQFGHHAGDDVLVAVAGALRRALRTQDVIARWGGEEFLLLLPETNLDNGSMVLDRLRALVAGLEIPSGPHRLRISITFGVAVAGPADDVEAVVKAADAALYEGKRQGKNRVVSARRATPKPRTQPEALQ
jgi:diguanylate cyclase (GGDEF)-like protein